MKITEVGQVNGLPVMQYTFGNEQLQVSVLNFGATVQSIVAFGTDVCLGFPKGEDYAKNGGYVGANVGRVANRIAGGRFSLNGKEFQLTQNEGKNQLHGGKNGFHLKFYKVEELNNGVKMSCVSPDGEEGYPGSLQEVITYTVDSNTFSVQYSADSDKDTIWAPTCHIYFNMDGEVGEATSNRLVIYADGYTPVDKELIPTGEIAPVDGTPFDFRKGMVIEDGVKLIGGYDHNFVLNGDHACTMTGDKSGLQMDIYTNLPCMQIYSGIASMGGVQGKAKLYYAKEGIALEPQLAPNAINMPTFQSPILRKDETKNYSIQYTFKKVD